MRRNTNRVPNLNASRRKPHRARLTVIGPDGSPAFEYITLSVRKDRALKRWRTIRASHPTAVLLSPSEVDR